MDRHLSPAETARRFGISIKALRLYEQHGLLKPLRTANGATGSAWRAYGPDQIVRLHQILALKRLGLSLARIGELLAGEDALDAVLALQERTLAADGERISRALMLIRKARAKLSCGAALSIDDLATLTQETVMTHPTQKELNKIVVPFMEKHLTPEENASIKQWNVDHPDLMNAGKDLMEEAKALAAAGDAASPAALDFARRLRALGGQFKTGQSPAIALAPKLKTVMEDVRSDPQASQKTEVIGFIQKAMANLKAEEDANKDGA